MKDWLVRWVLGGIVREIADGKRGEKARWIYWWLCGKKTITSAVAGLLYAGFAAWKPEEAIQWAPTVTFVLGLMVTIGIADKSWKSAPPPDEWKMYLSKVLSAGPVIAGVFALVANALAIVPGAPPEWIGYVNWAAGAFASVTAWLAARWNMPPEFMARRASDFGIEQK